jgi:glycosyltransferase involved in cell wall biosynthesis
VHCITNGFNPDDFVGADRSERVCSRFTIAYTGVSRPGYGPEALYQAILILKEQGDIAYQMLRVLMAGFAPGRAEELGLEDVIVEHGQVPHRQAIDLMLRADALFLPVSGGLYSTTSIPGKLFEYIGSERPIIALAASGSEVEQVLRAVGGAHLLLPEDVKGLARVLSDLSTRRRGEIFSPRIVAAAEKYRRDRQCSELALIFSKAAETRGRN